jgi:hypothetical protein
LARDGGLDAADYSIITRVSDNTHTAHSWCRRYPVPLGLKVCVLSEGGRDGGLAEAAFIASATTDDRLSP